MRKLIIDTQSMLFLFVYFNLDSAYYFLNYEAMQVFASALFPAVLIQKF